jgi:nitroreductase
MAVCPQGCITVNGRCFSPEDVVEPARDAVPASYNQLFDLMLKRRSVRNFTDEEVSHEHITKIITAATTAPMGIPPSEVGVTVLAGREKVAAFREDLIAQIRRMKRILAKPMVYVMRPFMSKEAFGAFVSFVPALFDAIDQGGRRGEDWLFYHAPLVMVFHTSSFGDPVDCHIAAAYATLAAEALGLGSCMIGSVGPVLKNCSKLKEKYGIPVKNQPGLAVILGHPAVEYRRNLRRSFAGVNFV